MDEPAKTSDAANTQTRRTVRLPKPVTPGDSMDTQTRKTVKIKPMASSPANTASRPIQPVIASPLRGRDTDTGNLSVMADTQTRRTVKLKPLTAAAHHPVQVPGIALPETPAAVPAAADSTVTAKVTMLKAPKTPETEIALPKSPTVNLSSAPEADDTVTGKIKSLRPAAPAKKTMVLPGTPAAVPADPAKKTMVLPGTPAAVPADPAKKTMVLPASDEDNSATVKISRPVRPGLGQRPTVAAPAPAPAPAVKPVLTPPAAPAAAEKPVLTAVPATAPAAAPAEEPEEKKISLKKTDAGAAPESGKKLSLKKTEDTPAGVPPIVEQFEENAEDETETAAPSMLYTVLTAVALLLLLVSAGLSAVSYLNLYEGKSISLPGVSAVK